MSASRFVRPPPWAWLALLAILLFDVWWRGHTFGPSVRERLGVNLWPVTGIESEPLDCDESAYAYIGRRINRGDVMYRDLTENKPPGGYWLYALAVALGGANEWTIRVMPVPLVLLTIILVWWIGLRLSGPLAATVAAGVYAVLSTDPYLYGNGANLEHALNLCAVASLAFMVRALRGGGHGALVTAGFFLGMACLVKQVAFIHVIIYIFVLLIRKSDSDVPITFIDRVRDVGALEAGFMAVWMIAGGVLIAQGAGLSAFDDIFRFGGALVTDTPPASNQPPFFVRWFTGNADPNSGEIPWPFGETDWLVWWGAGTWPIWLIGIVGLARLVLRPTDGPRRLVAAWTASAWVQVALPGLFWPHYYLLPTPGLALAVAVLLADAIKEARSIPGRWRRLPLMCVISATVAALGWTLVIQVRDYLLVKPQMLTIEYKGGRQWVAMRDLGRVMERRSAVWPSPRLFVWGWQSPLYLYSGLDSVTSEFFANELLKAHADGNHPVVRPHIDRLMRDLRARPPELIFAGDPPFPALRDFLLERGYHRSRFGPMPPDGPGSTDMRGLWVEPGRADQFEELFQISGRAPPPTSILPEPEIDPGPEPTPPQVLQTSALVDPAVPAAVIATIEDQISTQMKQHGIPGVSAAIVQDGRLVWSRGFGKADVENAVPVTTKTVFRFASISKPITAVAALQLAEQGRLDLDAPIQRYVPSFPEKAWPVTVRQLLGHLGGIRHYRGDEMHSTWRYFGLRHALTVFRNDPLVHEPGSKFLYSTYGYNLAGAAVQEIAGQRFSDHVRTHIFKPSGMIHTRVDDNRAIIPHRASGYIRIQGGRLRNSAPCDVSNRVPGAGFCGTAEDLARFAIAIESGALLKPETVSLMLQSQTTTDGKPTGYGLGWSIDSDDDTDAESNTVEVSHLGQMPRVSNVLLLRPNEHSAVVLLSNLEGQGGRLLDLAHTIADAVSVKANRTARTP